MTINNKKETIATEFNKHQILDNHSNKNKIVRGCRLWGSLHNKTASLKFVWTCCFPFLSGSFIIEFL